MFACASRIGSCGVSLIGRIQDRIVRGRLEAEHLEALLHMRRQRRGDVDHAAARMRQDQPPREEVQLWFDARRHRAQGIGARGIVLGAAVIFGVADDGMADRLAMRAQLMGASGDRAASRARRGEA